METINIILIIVGVLILWIIFTFNSLISLRNDVKKSFSGIDVQLKRRSDLIPNLVETVKGYAKHEKELLENVTKARTSIMNASNKEDIKTMAKEDNLLSNGLKSIFAVAENYPKLKANENFLKLQDELSETEDQIAASRRIYNENVTYFNTKIQTFPNNLLASMFNFKEKELFETSEKRNVKVKI
ncbi:hypothetical protein C0585_02470 [Candidatus Woesearchaeota archaeon]|nr:MAG: hypothetical protein C0585_02470 [Candidatus Woesearchaeota archaeon]